MRYLKSHWMISRTVRCLVGGLAGAALAVAVMAAPAGAATYHQATLFQPDRATLFNGGGSDAKFAISLTPGARCPTDTRTPPYYEAWGFVLPAATDPATVAFVGQLIDLKKGFPLVEQGRPFQYPVQAQTAAIPDPGNAFSLDYFDASDLLKGGATSATWQIGVACVPVGSIAGVTAHYPTVVWRVHIEVSAAKTDPHGFTWRALDRAKPGAGSGHGSLWLALGLIGMFVVGSVVFVAGRRSGRRSGPPRQTSDPGARANAPAVARSGSGTVGS